MQIRDLKVETVFVSSLTRRRDNPRTHSPRQIRQIAESIQTFGWTNPILIDDEGGVIAGHGRLDAAMLLGMAAVPVIRLSAMTPAQRRAYVIADNKLAENAGWDRELLRVELQGLLELDLDFDIGVIGFETAEIDVLLAEDGAEDDPADAPPELGEGPAVSRRGDLWRLGQHRLLCGDATNIEDVKRLMGGELASLVFIDPPYNVPIDGHAGGSGAIHHPDFVMASGEMSETEFIVFLQSSLSNLALVSRDGSIHFVCMDWRHMGELLKAGRAVFSELKNLCVWRKPNGGMGSLYRSQHELIFVFKNGTVPHINNVALGRYGRNRTNVWDYPGANSWGRREELEMHPTVKPVGLVEDAIKDCSNRGDVVLDGFAGSGTTLIAAERCGRRAFMLELDPKYADLIVRRFEAATGAAAKHAETGATFDAVRIEREWAEPQERADEGAA